MVVCVAIMLAGTLPPSFAHSQMLRAGPASTAVRVLDQHPEPGHPAMHRALADGRITQSPNLGQGRSRVRETRESDLAKIVAEPTPAGHHDRPLHHLYLTHRGVHRTTEVRTVRVRQPLRVGPQGTTVPLLHMRCGRVNGSEER